MIYHHLFKKYKKKDSVFAAIIGAGHFGTAVVTQQNYTEALTVSIVADKNLESAKNAFLKAEIEEDNIIYTVNAKEAQDAIMAGKFIYTDNVEMIMDVPAIDILCEGTGVPEAGARYCKLAIEKGKHVAIISKEMDSVIGPLLKKMAQEKGVVYTPVDGDQHGLLMQMVEWAKTIGLTVISAGKARDGEFIYNEKDHTVSIKADGITVHEDAAAFIQEEYRQYFEMIPEGKGKAKEYLDKRAEVLKVLPGAGGFDFCELTVMANSTGLKPYTPSLTQGTLRITEFPIAYCSTDDGGIYENEEGIIDIVTCFRRPDESGMGGGVFMVVRCDNAYSNYILTTKGQIPNHDCSTAVIYRPYHLCGVEVSTSLLSAAMLGIDTGSAIYEPKYDLVRIANRDIKKGEEFGNDHDEKFSSNIVPATKYGASNPVPAHMLNGNLAKRDIEKGEIITYDMVVEPKDSILWELRKIQESTF